MRPWNHADDRGFVPIQSVPLSRAQLCVDCETITEIDNSHCRTCGSHSVLPLARVIGKGEK